MPVAGAGAGGSSGVPVAQEMRCRLSLRRAVSASESIVVSMPGSPSSVRVPAAAGRREALVQEEEEEGRGEGGPSGRVREP
ncbi:hypothetical protein GCM10017562_42150 [Streptomyces roseofulvus]